MADFSPQFLSFFPKEFTFSVTEITGDGKRNEFSPYFPSMKKSSLNIRDRIEALLSSMGKDLFEKERILALTLLSSIAGESIFLLGPPGVAKSMIARRLKLAFKDARAFEYLMGKFSTPDEVFGPVSISRLKNEDKYERLTDHYLPGAQIVFLDEIWKASPPIQNALLTVLNEKIYRNGEQEVEVDIKGLIAASNELPAQGEGLEALWDRFLLRMVVGGIEEERAFERLLTLPFQQKKEDPVEEELKITAKEYQTWQAHLNQVSIPPHLLHVIHEIRRSIKMRNSTEAPIDHWYVSDRRWRKTANLLKASALLHDREVVTVADMLLLVDCLWDRFEQREAVSAMIIGDIIEHSYERLTKLGSVRTHLELWREEITEETRIVKVEQVIQPKLQEDVEGEKYVEILAFRGQGEAFMRVSDWQQLASKEERIFPLFEKREEVFKPIQRLGGRKVDENSIRIGGKEYDILVEEVSKKQVIPKHPDKGQLQAWNQQATVLLSNCDQRLAVLEKQVASEADPSEQHFFMAPELKPVLQQARSQAKRQILDLKLDIEKTQHSYEEMGEG